MQLIVRVQVKENGRFSIEFAKSVDDDSFYVIKSNRIVDGSKGRFISGPSFKPEDGDWINFTYAEKNFQDYIIGLVDDATVVQQPVQGGEPFDPDADLPF